MRGNIEMEKDGKENIKFIIMIIINYYLKVIIKMELYGVEKDIILIMEI